MIEIVSDIEDSRRGCVFFFQAEDGIRDLVRSRGLGDVYKRQALAALRQAVQLTRPGGFIRVFVDLGPSMQTLLLLSLIHI